jgi:hypothetical protein
VQQLAEALPDTSGAAGQQVQQGPGYQVHVLLPAFDLDRVLRKGQPLLASGGQVSSMVGSSAGSGIKQQLSIHAACAFNPTFI